MAAELRSTLVWMWGSIAGMSVMVAEAIRWQAAKARETAPVPAPSSRQWGRRRDGGRARGGGVASSCGGGSVSSEASPLALSAMLPPLADVTAGSAALGTPPSGSEGRGGRRRLGAWAVKVWERTTAPSHCGRMHAMSAWEVRTKSWRIAAKLFQNRLQRTGKRMQVLGTNTTQVGRAQTGTVFSQTGVAKGPPPRCMHTYHCGPCQRGVVDSVRVCRRLRHAFAAAFRTAPSSSAPWRAG
jgi:hypothetical protein